MQKRMTVRFALVQSMAVVAAALLVAAATVPAAEVNTDTLLEDMINLQRLTQAPDPAYRTVLFCSYERGTDTPGGEGWFANHDGDGGAKNPTYSRELQAPVPDGIGRYLQSGKGVRNRCCVFGGGLGDGRGPARSGLGCGCAALVVRRA